jgi:hypothetical protein
MAFIGWIPCASFTLFPEWILNTKGKFVAAAIGSLFVGIVLEASDHAPAHE